MYNLTIIKDRRVIHHSEEVDMEIALIFLLGFQKYNSPALNLHIDKFVDGKPDLDFSIAELINKNHDKRTNKESS